MKRPKLADYNVKTLVAIGEQSQSIALRDDIKRVLVQKLSGISYSMMYLLTMFMNSQGILREVYAELIMIMMYEGKFDLSGELTDEIIKLVSMDTLTKYGMECSSMEFSEKCINEFWNRALVEEDKEELKKKKNIDDEINNQTKLRKLVIVKKKGDYDEKY